MRASFPNEGFLNEPSVKAALLAGLEKQLDAALMLDPVSMTEIGKMAGIVVEVYCTEPKFKCYASLEKASIRLLGYYENEVDAGVRGPLMTLADLIMRRNQPIANITGLSSWGREDVLDRLSSILLLIELDWESVLCRSFGDVGGHLLAQGVRFLSKQAEGVRTIAAENLTDYLQEELRLVPSRNELDTFTVDVIELQEALSMLTDKVHKLDKQL
ncbi:MAG: hypothetical protein PUP46_03345 [Endozoicomonas sp. (ex Botrylloides leachii)]|nr:hypothetical protein [Endozoicomonas sp. (ex Botrylloides leachii)]